MQYDQSYSQNEQLMGIILNLTIIKNFNLLTGMSKQRPKWLAVGKEQGKYETRSQLLPTSRRILSNCVVEDDQNDFSKNRSAQYFHNLQKQFVKSHSYFQGLQKGENDKKLYNNIIRRNSFDNQRVQSREVIQKNQMQKDGDYLLVNDNNNRNQMQLHKQSQQIQCVDCEQKLCESVVLEQQNVIGERTLNDAFDVMSNQNIDSSQSEILESIYFPSEHKKKPLIRIQKQQYVEQNQIQNNQKTLSFSKQDVFIKSKTDQAAIKFKQLLQMTHQLKIIQQTIANELLMCHSSGKMPLFIGNKNIQAKLLTQIREVFSAENNHLSLRQKDNPSEVSNQSLQESMIVGKQTNNLELQQKIAIIQEKNKQLICQKQCLQEEIFILQQKMIGVQIQIEQKIRKDIKNISLGLQGKIIKEHKLKLSQMQRQNLSKSQCYLQTIETLSKQVANLNQKCKYYQKYICDQQSIQSTVTSKNLTQNHEYEDIINRRLAQIQTKQHKMISIQDELLLKEDELLLKDQKIKNFQLKLKDSQLRLQNEAIHIQKQQQILTIRQEQFQKYHQQLNTREEELYDWQNTRNEQQELLNRKINQFKRLKYQCDNQKVNGHSQMSPFPVTQVIQGTNVPSTQTNSLAFVGLRSNNQFVDNLAYVQKAYSDRVVLSKQTVPKIYYEPTYQINKQVNHSKKHSKTLYQYQTPNQGQCERQQYTGYSIQKRHFPKNSSTLKELRSRFNNQDIQFHSSYEQQSNPKNTRQNMRVRTDPIFDSNYDYDNKNTFYHKSTQNKHPEFKLYTAQDKMSQAVEQILSRRTNDKFITKLNNRNSLSQPISKSQLKRLKFSTDQKANNQRQEPEQRIRQNKQKIESRKVYEKPLKYSSQIYRVTNPSTASAFRVKNSSYDINKDISVFTNKQYTPKYFSKQNIPSIININQKLEKLKQEIKRQVRALQ